MTKLKVDILFMKLQNKRMRTATIYNPQNNSLESRIKALKETRLALDNAEHYLHQNKTKGFDSVIGTKEEIEYAFSVSENSYQQAIDSLSRSDLTKAKDQKLLSQSEYSNLIIQKDKQRIRNLRDNDQSFSKDRQR